MLRREPVCPAALSIAGASRSQQGVICRVMQRDQAEDPGVDMTAGQLGVLREGEGGTYINIKSDPSSVTGFCHGDAVPVLAEDDESRASYTVCPVWQAEKERIAAGREMLFEPVEAEPVSMGVTSDEMPDPWAAARRGLDELAPAQERELARAVESDPRAYEMLKVAGRV